MHEVNGVNEIRIDPRKQFSKKLAKWTAVFWFFFMSWLTALMLLEPSVAIYTVYMGIIVTVVMIVNVWAYTHNSVYEKACFAMLNKAKIEIGLKANGGTPKKEDSTGEDDAADDDTGEVSNG